MVVIFVVIAVFVCVAGLAGGVMLLVRDKEVAAVEDRLNNLTGNGAISNAEASQPFLSTFADHRSALEEKVAQFIDLRRMLEQAGIAASPDKIILLSIVVGIASGSLWLLVGLMPWLGIFIGLGFGTLPVFFVAFKRGRRLKKFGSQLPEALELISRA